MFDDEYFDKNVINGMPSKRSNKNTNFKKLKSIIESINVTESDIIEFNNMVKDFEKELIQLNNST